MELLPYSFWSVRQEIPPTAPKHLISSSFPSLPVNCPLVLIVLGGCDKSGFQTLYLGLWSQKLRGPQLGGIRNQSSSHPDELGAALRDHEGFALVKRSEEVRIDAEPLLSPGAPEARWSHLVIDLMRHGVGALGPCEPDDLLGVR